MSDFAAWRARSNQEIMRLLCLFDDRAPICAYLSTADSITFMVPHDEDTVELVILTALDYPCTVEHVQYYGDSELLALLRGEVAVENLSENLQSFNPPQTWVNALRSRAQLSAPHERPHEHIPAWVIETLKTGQIAAHDE